MIRVAGAHTALEFDVSGLELDANGNVCPGEYVIKCRYSSKRARKQL
jgi:hypothetical protein